MKLLIVESPSKAKTITKYLKNQYKVVASVGHIRDLPKNNKQAIDIEHDFKPHYEISPDKGAIVAELKKLTAQADEIYLATDPDREGEAIAWHIAEACHIKKPRRVTFHEITPKAIQEAILHPRTIDQNLRKAQEARRVLDRLVGYDLSGLIWKKLRYGLSAGRVQSPALRILAEREREITNFIPDFFLLYTGLFQTSKKKPISLTYTTPPQSKSQEIKMRAEAERLLTLGRKGSWHIGDVKETPTKRAPYPPFTTSTLQQAASSRLGYAPSITMRLAQKLYEQGFITYMRTDSVTLSTDAKSAIAEFVINHYGKELFQERHYITKSKNAQEAHEAIRPTDISLTHGGRTPQEKKLYQLIHTRAVTSQMIDAQLLRTKITAVCSHNDVPTLQTTGSVVVTPGWLICDTNAKNDDVILPSVTVGEILTLNDFSTEEKYTEPPRRYSEAGLVKELEKRGIGRPSTYASIIKTLYDREYVAKEGRSLRVTDTGDVVSAFLEKHFADIISDDFTAGMEEELDDIALGKRDYAATLKKFYTPFAKQVKSKEKIEKMTTLGDAPKGMKCPECGGAMVLKLARTGKFYSCAKFPDCIGARTLEGEVRSNEGPKKTGEICPECKGELVERTGKNGAFVACGNFPKCKYIKKAEYVPTGNEITCPVCNKGSMIERKGRFGIFYSCSNYPDCKYAIKAKPTGNICPQCQSLMMEGTKTIPERCSNKICPNHRPDKLGK
ncbi:MAG: type I DNA topoisomerase [Candidatus Moraniibacteriota bacterium]